VKGWTELCSDVNWIDYHGMWTRKARDGSWYVISWTNLLDAGGIEFADTPYGCEVKRVDLASLPQREIKSALDSYGWKLGAHETSPAIIDPHSGDIVAQGERVNLALVECCVRYGLGEPLESYQGAKYPARIRAEARRFAESCMKDAALLDARLDRTVNAIGSTAREYGRGDIDAALHRGPFDASKNLMRKLHGLPSGE
jgi:hypothetical protein